MNSTLIVGGGPAGASLAIRLAQAGVSVSLIERETGPHDKVCGEFLSFEATMYLRQVGLELATLGAVGIDTVEIYQGGRSVATRLPFHATSLSRRVMDEALLKRAAEVGATILRGDRVTRIDRDGKGWISHTSKGQRFQADQTFLATGKHDIRGRSRPSGSQSDLIGFKTYWALSKGSYSQLSGRVELHLFPGGYAGFQSVNGSLANLCLVVRNRTFRSQGGDWKSLLRHILRASISLASRLENASCRNAKPLAIGSIPYGHVQHESDGLWRLGDQAAVIPSFSGEGMSIAMHSARLASDVFLSGGSAQDYQTALARDVARQVSRATLVSQALVRPISQSLIRNIAGGYPQVVASAATLTRLPHSALR